MDKKIVVFSDVHYAKSWDSIEARLKQMAVPLTGYLNPNRELRRFIQRINAAADIEVVINNGDAVDYHFSDYATVVNLLRNSGNPGRSTNRELFNAEISRLEKPYIAIPGNHDYRKEAYNYMLWGTDHVNLGRADRRKYKKLIGHQRFRGPFELTAITVNESRFNPLDESGLYRKKEVRRFGRFHCVFLDSGCDAFARPANFFKCLETLVRTKQVSYDADGLNSSDIDYVSRILSSVEARATVLIFFHAPLINPRRSAPHRRYRLSVDAFRRSNMKQKIAYNTMVNGGGELLNVLRNAPHNIILVSSHIHNAKYFLIQKQNLTVEEVSNRQFNLERDNPIYIKQVTTLPLGGIYRNVGGLKTGFLQISSRGFEEIVIQDFNGCNPV